MRSKTPKAKVVRKKYKVELSLTKDLKNTILVFAPQTLAWKDFPLIDPVEFARALFIKKKKIN